MNKLQCINMIFAICTYYTQGEKDWAKYETARKLKSCVDSIRTNYEQDLRAKEMKIRQRCVCLQSLQNVLAKEVCLLFLS